jgi:hypothetical protein
MGGPHWANTWITRPPVAFGAVISDMATGQCAMSLLSSAPFDQTMESRGVERRIGKC